MTNGFKILLPILLLATLACSLGVESGSTEQTSTQDSDRPLLILLAPQEQSQYAVGVPILLHAEARDLEAGIAKIEFYDTFDTLIGSVSASNPQGDPNLSAIVSWQPPSVQTHFVRAKAFRADGTESNVEEVSVGVAPLPEGFSLPSAASEAAPVEVNPAPAVEGSSFAQTLAQTEAEATDVPVTGQGGAEQAVVNPPAITSLQATISIDLANVRVSPNLGAAMAMNPLSAGASVELAWRTADSQWVATPLANGGYGWIFAVNSMNINGDINNLPVATTE